MCSCCDRLVHRFKSESICLITRLTTLALPYFRKSFKFDVTDAKANRVSLIIEPDNTCIIEECSTKSSFWPCFSSTFPQHRSRLLQTAQPFNRGRINWPPSSLPFSMIQCWPPTFKNCTTTSLSPRQSNRVAWKVRRRPLACLPC